MPDEKENIPYGRQCIDEADIQAVIDVLRSDYLTTGSQSGEFEKLVCRYTGAKYAVAVSNGTAALHAACYAADIRPGDEVITSPLTFAASANCVLYCGGKPVFADVDEQTYNIDPAEIERKITSRTKAVIPVHLAGQPCDMKAIREIAQKHNLAVIEDGAHALGAFWQGRPVGTGSDMVTFSFHPVKPITTGEGGMVVTDREDLYQKIRLFRSHCITRETDAADLPEDAGSWFYSQTGLGYNYRMTDIQAALGISQMGKLEQFLAKRRKLAARYTSAFAGHPDLILPYQLPGGQSGWHLYMVQILHHNRRKVFEKMRQAGIEVNVHYIPVYQHLYYRTHGYADTVCPVAEKIYSRLMSLPLYPALTDRQQDYVIETLLEILKSENRKA